jgi:hypothetical protein
VGIRPDDFMKYAWTAEIDAEIAQAKKTITQIAIDCGIKEYAVRRRRQRLIERGIKVNPLNKHINITKEKNCELRAGLYVSQYKWEE